MSARPLRILCDVDGVIADWLGAVLKAAHAICGRTLSRDEVTNWLRINDLADRLGMTKEQCRSLHDALNAPGFCRSFETLGNRLLHSNIGSGNEVLYVTTPWESSKTWCYDRWRWLLHHGFTDDTSCIIQVPNKKYIWGDVMIDDKPENIHGWIKEWGGGIGLLWNQSWNRHDTQLTRVRSWIEVHKILHEAKQKGVRQARRKQATV